jgi:hypothetical protein
MVVLEVVVMVVVVVAAAAAHEVTFISLIRPSS